MRVIDAFCGTGGWSAGAVAAGCTPVLGIDSDAAALKSWATNCSPAGRAACATIGVDAIDWPEAAPDVHVHLSPPCTSLSKARAGSASATSVATALEVVRGCVQLNTSHRNGTPCVRSTQQPAFTVTASHPLIWCTRTGATVRCLTVAESAVLMGFLPDWAGLGLGLGLAIHRHGLVLAPGLAQIGLVRVRVRIRVRVKD